MWSFPSEAVRVTPAHWFSVSRHESLTPALSVSSHFMEAANPLREGVFVIEWRRSLPRMRVRFLPRCMPH